MTKKIFSKKKAIGVIPVIVALIISAGYYVYENHPRLFTEEKVYSFSIDELPEFSSAPYVVIDGNIPNFDEDELTAVSYESYQELDALGRCGETVASIGRDIMPTGERGEIGMIKPTGWHTVKYDIVDGNYLYNRCHLIGWQLTGENANTRNLITGTRYMNVDGMLPFEDMVADYVKETGNHVAYRVTPVFEGDNLVATGVQMEALSVEDGGEGICFNVFCYNAQPGIEIDYKTGESRLTENYSPADMTDCFIINKNSKKFHLSSCDGAADISDKNKGYGYSREILIMQGYSPCNSCNP